MKLFCPKCDTRLGAAQLNIAADVAACPNCDEVFAISSIVSAGHLDDVEFNIQEPPKGVSFQDTGMGWEIIASTRSATAFFLVPFMCVWSGFSLGGIYGTQIVNGKFNLGMSLFGIPFVLGTLLFGSIAVMSVCGRVVVSADGNFGRVFTGVGPVGWTRRFDWQSISLVEEDLLDYQSRGSNGPVISLVGKTRLKFGSGLTDARRYYVLKALQRLLAQRDR